MTTLTATRARQRLGALLGRALQGEDIGIVHSGSGRIVALRQVEVYSEDYALVEYGLSAQEAKRAEKRIVGSLKREKARCWDGTAEGLRH